MTTAPQVRPATLGASVAFASLAATRLADAAFDVGLDIGFSLAIAAIAGVVATVAASASATATRRSGELVAAPDTLGPTPVLYELFAGEIHLDLTGARRTGRPAVVYANLRFGEIEVRVPDDAFVEVHTRGLIGDAAVFGETSGGFRARQDVVPIDDPDLVLHLVVTVGDVKVVYGPASGGRVAPDGAAEPTALDPEHPGGRA